METIHENAFDRLKLVVELDFSWNKLKSIPLFHWSQLILLRRLTLRGNPLITLTDKTFSAAAASTKSDKNISNLEASNSSSSLLLSRFVETYPELANSLIQSMQAEGEKFTSGKQEQLNADSDSLQLLEQIYNSQTGNKESNELQPDSELVETPEVALAGSELENQSLGSVFDQIQELDFGQCQLEYIRWTVLMNLKSLKRLLLDGNNLR